MDMGNYETCILSFTYVDVSYICFDLSYTCVTFLFISNGYLKEEEKYGFYLMLVTTYLIYLSHFYISNISKICTLFYTCFDLFDICIYLPYTCVDLSYTCAVYPIPISIFLLLVKENV